MRAQQAIVALGLFGWASYAVLTDGFPGGDGGAGKTRGLKALVDAATDRFRVIETAIGLALAGVLLAGFFLMRGRAERNR